ncbi:pilus assembly protein TadG-related protein [Streptomyces erythrochromogenes]|uniref:pilus assembly protein TadG-related protein n=1 Tax=Streptomyces erythrochromogenes TaxID=285574 RepID=UPI0036A8DB08
MTADRGQAFPIYIVVVGGLLFAALAFFAVGMAGATRSNAQGAADAAALAAAREARDGVFQGLNLADLTSSDWGEVLRGEGLAGEGACAAAERFAALNEASAKCVAAAPRFTVSVTTDGAVGESVIPGTEDRKGTAVATAVIESRCTLGSLSVVPSPSPTPSPSTAAETPPAPSASAASYVSFVCKGAKPIKLDPLKPGPLSQLARNLFSVRLVD